MIEHTVTFELKHARNSLKEQAFLDAAFALAQIPGVKDFAIRRQTSPKNNHRFGITMCFDSKSLYEAYSSHPKHEDFIQRFWLDSVISFQEADFESIHSATLIPNS